MTFREYIKTLTDKELIRLNRRTWEHLDMRCGGGSWDWPTLRMVYPGFHHILSCLNEEGWRRGDERRKAKAFQA